ncbi:hypothetical protein LTR70_010142 [Exophiala xenobiotica]|uniref:Zn(2)-C6 fungal-type domain-containing protein n=1 Tax=Lithohypha guttulata TaxID=1690604 RepID=A0ABR0JUZ3_9EURO|nr:hypothetical protein LTR24_010099 [Lithohypha guttulata]KAK5309601.1 hypothetical protein LTR70_010142 [Exophiala xenobiotica]
MDQDLRQRRSRKGCRSCRRKKKKCDEAKPICSSCIKTSEKCIWGRPLSFLPQNNFTVNENADSVKLLSWKDLPQREQAQHGSRTNSDTSKEWSPPQPGDFIPPLARQHGTRRPSGTGIDNGLLTVDLNTNYPLSSSGPLKQPRLTPTITQMPPIAGNCTVLPKTDFVHQDTQPQHRLYHLPPIVVEAHERLVDINSPDQPLSAPDISPAFELSPDMLTDDGIFLPGSTYQELHTTLRQHVFENVKLQESRQASPMLGDLGAKVIDGSDPDPSSLGPDPTGVIQADSSEGHVDLSPAQEYLLWKNWTNEIADWLDKFDNDRHFVAFFQSWLKPTVTYVTPCSLSALDSVPASLALSLYQAAVYLLVIELHCRNTSVVASCVVICVLEMMSCSPKA